VDSTQAAAAPSDAAAAYPSLHTPPHSASGDSTAANAESIAARIAHAQAGSTAALGELLESCRNYLLLVANRELGDDLQAKLGASDVVQETFVQAQQVFHRFHGNENEQLLAWLAQILEHKLAHARRQFTGTQKRDVHREISFEGSPEATPGGNGKQAPRGSTPSSIVAGKEEQHRLEVALARLPDDMRRVVELRSLERMPFAEVGVQLQRSSEAARKLWVRAICRLQQLLDEVSRDPST